MVYVRFSFLSLVGGAAHDPSYWRYVLFNTMLTGYGLICALVLVIGCVRLVELAVFPWFDFAGWSLLTGLIWLWPHWLVQLIVIALLILGMASLNRADSVTRLTLYALFELLWWHRFSSLMGVVRCDLNCAIDNAETGWECTELVNVWKLWRVHEGFSMFHTAFWLGLMRGWT